MDLRCLNAAKLASGKKKTKHSKREGIKFGKENESINMAKQTHLLTRKQATPFRKVLVQTG